MTTHALIFRNGKYWFTQDHDGYPGYTGKLILAVLKKFGSVRKPQVKLYFSPCDQDGGEWEYDIRRDGVYYRLTPGCITVKATNGSLQQSFDKEEQVWELLTEKVTGFLKDYEAFLADCMHKVFVKDSPVRGDLDCRPRNFP